MLLYRLLAQKAGKIVPYREIESVFCCKKDRTNLVMYVTKLRRKLEPYGFMIETHNRIGYRLEKPKRKPVYIVPINDATQAYATEMECIVRGMLSRDDVDFESQVGILGVVIGSILHQLPPADRNHCIKVLITNINEAESFVQTVGIQ